MGIHAERPGYKGPSNQAHPLHQDTETAPAAECVVSSLLIVCTCLPTRPRACSAVAGGNLNRYTFEVRNLFSPFSDGTRDIFDPRSD